MHCFAFGILLVRERFVLMRVNVIVIVYIICFAVFVTAWLSGLVLINTVAVYTELVSSALGHCLRAM